VESLAQGNALWKIGAFSKKALKGRNRPDYALSGLWM
jgi:hypothetical protein